MIDIDVLNKQLIKENARWTAGETPVSKLASAQYRGMLGLLPEPTPSPATRITNAPGNTAWSPSDPFDSEVDWRSRNGKNFVTSVKDQGNCGTCASFAVCALVESTALVEKGAQIDLSESDLAFCGSHKADCSGWSQTGALNDLKNRGVVTDGRYSYQSAFSSNGSPKCIAVPNHGAFSVRIGGYGNLFTVSERKSYLTHVGPMVAGITAYSDLPAYKSGVYSPSSTAIGIGGHDILIIGYSESEQCWIFKNSWGVCWGEAGFGKMAYGACDIDIQTPTEKTYFTSCSGVTIPALVSAELVASRGLSTVAMIPSSTCCDAFYSADDSVRHAIEGTSDGQIFDVAFNPQTGVTRTLLATRAGLRDVAGFYTADDKMRHVISLDARGGLEETWYSSPGSPHTTSLANIANAVRVCAFYSPDDRERHAVVATSDGKVIEIFYGTAGNSQTQIATINNLVDICGFYSPDDSYRHVIAGSADGTITEIYYNPQKGVSQTTLGKVPNLLKLGGFYTASTDAYSRRVLILSTPSASCSPALAGSTNATEIRYSSPNGAVTTVLQQFQGALDVGGFYSADDGYSHAIIALTTGVVDELFYKS